MPPMPIFRQKITDAFVSAGFRYTAEVKDLFSDFYAGSKKATKLGRRRFPRGSFHRRRSMKTGTAWRPGFRWIINFHRTGLPISTISAASKAADGTTGCRRITTASDAL